MKYSRGSIETNLFKQYEILYGTKPDLKTKLNYVVITNPSNRFLLATTENMKKIKEGEYTIDIEYYLTKIKSKIRKLKRKK